MKSGESVLVVAHPGHELRLHGWLESEKPIVLVLTDGSGSSKAPRIASSARVIDAAGASAGSVFGCISDLEAYSAVIRGDHAAYISIARRVADEIMEVGATRVVGDAAEGFNPIHDVCRLTINAAVAIARRATGRDIESLEFPLIGHPCRLPDQAVVSIGLSDRAFERKLGAATSYIELAAELEGAVDRFGTEPFRMEYLYEAREGVGSGKPYYETFGEKRVQEGVYKEVLRREEHIIPLARALEQAGRP